MSDLCAGLIGPRLLIDEASESDLDAMHGRTGQSQREESRCSPAASLVASSIVFGTVLFLMVAAGVSEDGQGRRLAASWLYSHHNTALAIQPRILWSRSS
jgi:hypothetical protein